MKKVTYLFTILFAVVLMSTSCCKDDPLPDNEQLSEALINGSEWISISYNGHTPTCADGDFTNITLSKTDTGSEDFRLLDNCIDNDDSFPVSISLGEGEFHLSGNQVSFEFDVISYEDELLTLQLTYTNIQDVPDNGIYVLEKQ